jgi:NADPH:quinone reductase-like Zn-dependent oxidoreductase
MSGELPAVPRGIHVFNELAVRGVWVTNWFRNAPRSEIESVVHELVDLVARGVLTVPVDSTFPIAHYADALARATAPERSGKVLLTFDAAQAH